MSICRQSVGIVQNLGGLAGRACPAHWMPQLVEVFARLPNKTLASLRRERSVEPFGRPRGLAQYKYLSVVRIPARRTRSPLKVSQAPVILFGRDWPYFAQAIRPMTGTNAGTSKRGNTKSMRARGPSTQIKCFFDIVPTGSTL
jgi:hypothetical protein